MVTFGVTVRIPLAPQKRVVYSDSSFFLFLFSVRVSEVMTNFFLQKNCHDGDIRRHHSKVLVSPKNELSKLTDLFKVIQYSLG